MMERKKAQQGQTVHPATVACDLMMRADLKGAEVEAFAQTYNWLQALLEGELVILEKNAFQEYENERAELVRYREEFGLFVDDEGDSGGKSQGETSEVTGDPMEVTPENESVGEDIPILAVDEDPQGAVDPSQL
jgi:hypothetical protein